MFQVQKLFVLNQPSHFVNSLLKLWLEYFESDLHVCTTYWSDIRLSLKLVLWAQTTAQGSNVLIALLLRTLNPVLCSFVELPNLGLLSFFSRRVLDWKIECCLWNFFIFLKHFARPEPLPSFFNPAFSLVSSQSNNFFLVLLDCLSRKLKVGFHTNKIVLKLVRAVLVVVAFV